MSHTTRSGGKHSTASGLVKKIETSPLKHKKRVQRLKRKMSAFVKEHRRMSKIYGLYAVAITLTYPVGSVPSGKHVSSFIDKLRAKLKRMSKPLLYVWTLECATAYHYHLMIWLPRGMRLDPKLLTRWWPHGHSDAEMCRFVFRWAKYIAKPETKQGVAQGLRLFGAGGLDQEGQDAVRFAGLPRWLQGVLPVLSRPKRIPKVGWVDMLTGELFICPYVWTSRGMRLRS